MPHALAWLILKKSLQNNYHALLSPLADRVSQHPKPHSNQLHRSRSQECRMEQQHCLLCKPVRHPPAHRRHVISYNRDFPTSVSRERVGTAVAAVRSSGETKRGGRSTHHGSLIRQSPYLVDFHHLLAPAGLFLLLGGDSSFKLLFLPRPNSRLVPPRRIKQKAASGG